VGKRERYEPGTFCWVDLATTDPAGAKAFYGELFGWEAEDMPAGEAGTYTMLRLDGDEVCALYELEAGRRELGVPSHWFSYVSVEDAEATAKRAEELGGTVHGEAFDVLDAGQMAIVQDPTGAVLRGLAANRARRGAPGQRYRLPHLKRAPEPDPETAAAFYAGLFGWKTEPIKDDGKLVYVTIKNAGSENGGIMPMTEQHGDAPPHWLPYFTVPSCDGAIAKVRELGGDAMTGPIEVPAGRISVLRDPQGAAFAIFEGETDE
jgi:predicted enzyme related to lactoylglutathione lyase